MAEIVQEKVEVSVYFKEDSPEEDILECSETISRIPEVKEVEYISQDEALEMFAERHREDPLLMESLEELGVNPFLASLSIRAMDSGQYQSIIDSLEISQYQPLIHKIDYYQKKPILEKLNSIHYQVNKFGFIFSVILGMIAVLVAFNQVQLSLHNSKQEIGIMRMVGASNFFIRGPFVIQGIMIGTLAALIAALIFGGGLLGLNSKIESAFPGLNLLGFFTANFLTIFSFQLLTGIGIGVFASLIAIRKYLKV